MSANIITAKNFESWFLSMVLFQIHFNIDRRLV